MRLALVLLCAALQPQAALADWTGIYAGGTVAGLTDLGLDDTKDLRADATFDDGTAFGGFAGFRATSNGVTFGYEVAVQAHNAPLTGGAGAVDMILDLKASAGNPAGPSGDVLLYGIFSASAITGSLASDDVTASGIGFGFGAAYQINDQFALGGEYLARFMSQRSGISGIDVTGNTLSLRAEFHY